MKNMFFLCICLAFCLNINATNNQDSISYRIFMTGASFASRENTWFEMACRQLNAQPVNRAVGGEAIANSANRMIEGTLYSPEELENMDAFVIMQVHNRDVFDEATLKSNYKDYPTPFNRDNYAIAYDYVIKRYITECYELRNNPQSKYYGTLTGKPVVVVLCTDWHDVRETYNSSIRKLAAKWGFPLVEFDKYIGFSDFTPNPVTGQPVSLIYSTDTQIINDVKYGFHPIRGEQSYIQQRMAAIFVELMKKILPVKPDAKK
ncbi:MAG: DUF5040 domain-containing protein [Dysgonamonadaceae bacterium]|jgi:hypothetical protein|nr:DUF5040 domain-containing protein [Dysgonamonadaceae bacterium]